MARAAGAERAMGTHVDLVPSAPFYRLKPTSFAPAWGPSSNTISASHTSRSGRKPRALGDLVRATTDATR
jgi:hypothetical protein